MRNRPGLEKQEEDFIQGASATRLELSTQNEEDLHVHVQPHSWPLDGNRPSPSLATGSTLKKPIHLYLNEQEWRTIDRHTKVLGLSKQEWIKHAILKLLEEEQMFFLHDKTL